MNRRQLCSSAIVATLLQRQASACDVERLGTPIPGQPVETAATFFRWAGNEGLRTMAVRVRAWPDEADAQREHRTIMATVGPTNDDEQEWSETYSSDKVQISGRALGEDIEEELVAWTRIEGVAAFTTATVVLTLRRWTTLWDASITSGSLVLSLQSAYDLSDLVLTLEPGCTTIAPYLPTVDDLPPGATEEPYPFGSTTG